MGVPAFFRWVSQKFPKIIVDVIEEEPREVDDQQVPVDTSGPNPNGVEFDNLYLDMNGIIHPCCHPEDRPAPTTEEEMMICIFDYMDRLFAMVRPRKLLFMAIDGVAPRAKMNQQRSRRFRAAKEAKEKEDEEERLREEWAEKGMDVPAKSTGPRFDSNVITPGTPFMANLATALKYYIHDRLNTDPGWSNVKVLLSDASVPGEGEHKIMDYIRRQRAQPGYDPNTKHVVYGLDADLIMLSLATHEPHFWVLREMVFMKDNNSCFICGQAGHLAADCQGKAKTKEGEFDEKAAVAPRKPYQFLLTNVLREYLDMEFRPELEARLPFPYDFERVVDDFVLMCCFVGNDFLPHMPSLEIREGAIDRLMELYKKVLPTLPGYLTEDGNVFLDRVEVFVKELGLVEDEIFQRRKQNEERQKARQKRQAEDKARQQERQRAILDGPGHMQGRGQGPRDSYGGRDRDSRGPSERGNTGTEWMKDESARRITEAESLRDAGKLPAHLQPVPIMPFNPHNPDSNKVVAGSLKSMLLEERKEVLQDLQRVKQEEKEDEEEARGRMGKAKQVRGEGDEEEDEASPVKRIKVADGTAAEGPGVAEAQRVKNAKAAKEFEEKFKEELKDLMKKKSEVTPEEDAVKLGEAGWKDRYYRCKFGEGFEEGSDNRRRVYESFMQGLCWVMRYYYQGCASWTWFYPFHYAPFASDFVNLTRIDVDFQLGTPFKPFEQLMGVLPAASSHALPPAYRKLMSSPASPIIDFYPVDFALDMNGKKFTWQAVALLCFIDEARLLDAVRPLEATLTPEETRRNSNGSTYLFVHSTHHPLGQTFRSLYCPDAPPSLPLDPILSYSMSGSISPATSDPSYIPLGRTYPSPLQELELPPIPSTQASHAIYDFPPKTTHRCQLHPNCDMPKAVLQPGEYVSAPNFGGPGGRGRGNRGGYGGNRGGGFGGNQGRGGDGYSGNNHGGPGGGYNNRDQGGSYNRGGSQHQPNGHGQGHRPGILDTPVGRLVAHGMGVAVGVGMSVGSMPLGLHGAVPGALGLLQSPGQHSYGSGGRGGGSGSNSWTPVSRPPPPLAQGHSHQGGPDQRRGGGGGGGGSGYRDYQGHSQHQQQHEEYSSYRGGGSGYGRHGQSQGYGRAQGLGYNAPQGQYPPQQAHYGGGYPSQPYANYYPPAAPVGPPVGRYGPATTSPLAPVWPGAAAPLVPPFPLPTPTYPNQTWQRR